MTWFLTFVVSKLGMRRTIEYAGVLVFVLLLIGWGLVERHRLIVEGEHIAIERVNRANAEAEAKAKKGQDDVAQCYDNGRGWDRARGMCVDPGASE